MNSPPYIYSTQNPFNSQMGPAYYNRPMGYMPNEEPDNKIRFKLDYFKSISGILRVVLIVWAHILFFLVKTELNDSFKGFPNGWLDSSRGSSKELVTVRNLFGLFVNKNCLSCLCHICLYCVNFDTHYKHVKHKQLVAITQNSNGDYRNFFYSKKSLMLNKKDLIIRFDVFSLSERISSF